MGLETATIIAIVSAVVSVGTAVYAMNQASDETNAGTAVTKQGSQNSRNKVYGKAIVGTTRVYSNVKDRDQSYRTDVFDVGGIGTLRFHNVWIEDKKMFEEDKSILTYPLSATNGTFDSSHMRDTYKKSDEFKVQFRSGHENQVAANLARLNSDGEWTSAHKGANVPHLVIYADYTTDQDYVMFSDNYNVKVLVSSEDLYDPRTGQFNGDSSNPALAIRDYLTSTYYGLSITPDYIDDESIIVAANLCEFYGLEINTAIDGGASFSDVLNDMLSTFGGALTIHQGKIQILFEDSVDAPLYEFNSDNILKGSFTVTPTSSSGYCNVVTATFKSGINGEKSDDYVIPADTLNDPRIIEDGSIQSKTFDMPYTVDAYEEDNGVVSRAVKFRANREYKRALFQTTCSFDVDLLEYPLLNIWSVISLSDPIYGFENKLFRVQSMVSSTDEKGLNIATLTLIEYDESVYLTDIEGSSVSIPLPIRSDVISPPTGVTFNVESFITNGYGVLKWSAGSYTGATGYDVEYRISTEGNTNSWVRLVSGHSKESYDIYGLKNSSYDFRVRTNDRILGTSVWVELTAEEVTTPYSLPSVTSLTVDASSKDFVLSWDDMSSTVIPNKTDDTNPNSADSTGTLGDVLSHYLIKVYSGETLKGTFTTSESTFVYMHAENAKTTLARTLNFQVSIVDKSGNVSGVEAVNGSNLQEDKPTAVTVTNTNGNSTIEWLPVLSPDFAGTVICVNESEDFIPSVDDIVTTLGQESFYVYNYDPSDITDRYVKIAHFDSFGNDSLKYSDAKLLQYVSINESVYYYIKPTKGTAIKNSVGSLDLEAHRVTMGVDEVITDGTVQLFIGDTEGGYKKTFDKDAISGSLVVTLKDGVNGSVLDSITLVDVTDGEIGSSAIYGSISSSGTLTWVQAPETALNTAGAWSPTSTSVNIVGTYYKEGTAVATKTVPVTRSAAGLLTVGDYTGDEDVTVVVSGGSTPAISIEFTYKNVTVTENLAAIVGAKHGDKGTTGDTGKGVKTQFSINGTTLWHDEPATNDAYLRTCTNTNGGSWTCGGVTKIKGNTGDTGDGVKTQFSADNSSWHDAPATGDEYIRTCTNSNGGAWSCSGSTLIKGETGVKGAKHYYVSGTEWNDTTASNYVKVSQGDALVTWDIVTIYSEANAFSVSKYWDGDSWEAVAEVIDGNLIVDGTVRAKAIDVDDLFAQDITATGTITGGNFVGGKVEVTSVSTSTKVTIDAGADSPIVVNDGTDDVLRFDSSNKLQLSGGLADSTIDNLNMFSPAIWEQIKAPLTEGSTGGAFSGDPVSGGDTLTSTVTMTNVNVNSIALSCRFNNNIFADQPATPKWTLTVTARVRNVSGEGNYGSVQNVHSQEYTGTAIVRDDTAFININYAETVSLTGVVSGGDIEFTFTASKVAGLTGTPRLTSLSASQAVSGGGQAGAAVLLDGQNGAYYLNYDNFTNKPTIPANTWRPLGTTSTTAAKGDHVHAWSTITDKPTTFAPSSHTHSDYLTDHQDISGKANLSGATFTGVVHLDQNPVGTTYGEGATDIPVRMFSQKVGDNDGWRMYGESPSSNDVKVIFEVVDDIETGDTWVFRNKKTYSPYTATEPFKITGEGNVTAAGTITATGGNSTKWNEAHGWGDHSTQGYITSISTPREIAYGNSTISGSNSFRLAGTGIQTRFSIVGYNEQDTEWEWRFTQADDASPSPVNVMTLTPTSSTSADLTVTGKVTADGGNSNEWNDAVTWGDHGDAGYATESYVFNAVNTLNLTSSSNMEISQNGRGISKKANDNNWDGEVRSTTGFKGGCRLAFTSNRTGQYSMIGINTDPTANVSYSSIDYCWYLDNTSLRIYENGGSKSTHGTYSAGDVFEIIYNNDKVIYYKNGVVERTVDVAAGLKFHLDSSFYKDLDNQVTILAFEPYASNSPNWDTAYGWGNHSSAGYQAASSSITTSNISSQSVNYATSAGSATSASNIDGIAFRNGNSTNGTSPDNVSVSGTSYVNSLSLLGQTDGALYSQAYSGSWVHQIYGDYRTGNIAVRGKNNGTWQSWNSIFSDTYHPNADKWTTARTITLSGDLNGSVSLDGSANVTLSAQVVNDSHSHINYVTTDTNQIVTGAKDLTSTSNHYNGHLYYNAYDANGMHYPHFLDGSGSTGVTVNWRIYKGSSLRLNTWDYNYNEFHTNVRAPIFYDSNDTGRYLDPNSTSNLNDLDVQGTLNINGKVGNIIEKAFIDFTVGGDANTYYPVSIQGGGHYAFQTYSISRGYSWTAPSTWNTSSHKGGLTLTWQNSGDSAWGGNDKTYRVIQFQETYSTMVGGMQLSVGGGGTHGGVVVWLRGGGATYKFHSPKGASADVNVHLSSVTAGNGTVYAPRSYSATTVNNEVYSRFPVRGTDQLYHENSRVIAEKHVAENGASKVLKTASNGYLYIQNWIQPKNGSGLFYPAGVHFHETGNYMYSSTGLQAANDMRAPIFYDRNSTGYFLHPDTSSESLVIRGSIRMEQGNTCAKGIELNSVKDSTWPFEFTTNDVGNDNSSGFWVGSNGYPDMRLRRDSGTVVALISSWEQSYVSNGFRVEGTTDLNGDLFVGSGTSSNIYMTDTDHGQRRIHCNSNRIGFLNEANGWGSYCGDGGDWYSDQSIRSPIFYDSDNTGYFLNPASGSNLNQIRTAGHISVGSHSDGSASTVDTSAVITFGSLATDAINNYSIQTRKENYGGNYNKLDLSFHTGIRLGAHPNYGGVRFFSDQTMGTEIASIGKSGDFIVGNNSVRSPIFYDSNNTGYYIHGDSNSNLNTLSMNGSLTFNNYGVGVTGRYSSTRFQQVFGMDNQYSLASDGVSPSNMYGIAWTHSNNTNTNGRKISGHHACFMSAGTTRAAIGDHIWTSGNITAYSDRRVKTNIEHIPDALDKVCKLNGYTFDRTDFDLDIATGEMPNTRQTGVIAQEVLEVLPEAVTGSEEEHYSVAYGNMVGLLIEAIKEQQTQIEGLSSQIKSLKENNYDNQ